MDTDDQIRLIKNICKAENIDVSKRWLHNLFLSFINQWKNKGMLPKDVIIKRRHTFRKSYFKCLQILPGKT